VLQTGDDEDSAAVDAVSNDVSNDAGDGSKYTTPIKRHQNKREKTSSLTKSSIKFRCLLPKSIRHVSPKLLRKWGKSPTWYGLLRGRLVYGFWPYQKKSYYHTRTIAHAYYSKFLQRLLLNISGAAYDHCVAQCRYYEDDMNN